LHDTTEPVCKTISEPKTIRSQPIILETITFPAAILTSSATASETITVLAAANISHHKALSTTIRDHATKASHSIKSRKISPQARYTSLFDSNLAIQRSISAADTDDVAIVKHHTPSTKSKHTKK